MENQNYAAIDIGSNGARLLIKNVCEDNAGNYEFSKVFFLRIPLRLGKDVFTLGEITEERERMMMCTIKSYKQLMKLYNVKKFHACANNRGAPGDGIVPWDAVMQLLKQYGYAGHITMETFAPGGLDASWTNVHGAPDEVALRGLHFLQHYF